MRFDRPRTTPKSSFFRLLLNRQGDFVPRTPRLCPGSAVLGGSAEPPSPSGSSPASGTAGAPRRSRLRREGAILGRKKTDFGCCEPGDWLPDPFPRAGRGRGGSPPFPTRRPPQGVCSIGGRGDAQGPPRFSPLPRPGSHRAFLSAGSRGMRLPAPGMALGKGMGLSPVG